MRQTGAVRKGGTALEGRAGLQVTRRLYFHGMLTYDYFSVIKAPRAPDK